jgi:hypothetical protein
MNISNFSLNSLFSQASAILRQRFSVLLAACFFLWTPVLISTTLKAQNSCEPIVQWTNLPEKCMAPPLPSNTKAESQNLPVTQTDTKSPKVTDISTRDQKLATATSKEVRIKSSEPEEKNQTSGVTTTGEGFSTSTDVSQNDRELATTPPPFSSTPNPDLVGVIVGTGAAAVATIASAPAVGVAGVGIAIWFLVRTALSVNR